MSFELLNQVFALQDLPPSEKALLVFLAHKAHNDGTSIYPGIDAMIQATCHKKWQTLNLLRKLKERGYIVQVSAPGPRHLAIYHIPLNAAGMIAPQPIPPDVLAEEKEQRRRKKATKEVAALVDATADELHEVEASITIPETPAPEGELPEAEANYRDGYTPRSLPAISADGISLDFQISLAQQKVTFYEKRVQDTGGGAISTRMLQKAKFELALLQRQGDYAT